MAEASLTPLLAALESAIHQISRITTAGDAHSNALHLSSIFSRVTTVLVTEALGAGKVSRVSGARAASLLQSKVVCKLIKFLGGILRALGKCTLCSAPIELQAMWDLAVEYLHKLVTDGGKALWSPWLTQLLDGGMITRPSYDSDGFGKSINCRCYQLYLAIDCLDNAILEYNDAWRQSVTVLKQLRMQEGSNPRQRGALVLSTM
jgi:hypothetical protein